ncbi:MAG: PAS domain S-box protein [Terriglobales bacterium]
MQSTRGKAAAAASQQSMDFGQLYQQLLEKSPANVMYADKNFVIRYMNQSSLETLKKVEHLLPFKANEVVGKSIDSFHKDPARIRAILTQGLKLPHYGMFLLGTERMELTAHAILDGNGEVSGYMAAWDIVTEKFRLQQSIQTIFSSRPCIEFDVNGTVTRANDLFLELTGYAGEDILGKSHSMFVPEKDRKSTENADLWSKLEAGIAQTSQYRRLGKGNKELWLACTYYPIPDATGKIYQIMQFATDVTQQKLRDNDFEGQIKAISESQAVIEFNLDGTVIHANDNFLHLLGYTLDEIKGKHHSLFVDEAYRQSAAYKEFWAKLNRGEYVADEFKRIGKGGKEVWIQASYNPILDVDGKPFKVVKYATDVTEMKLKNADYQGQISSIGKSQAVIGFNMDGTVITANENFLKALGYTLDEIKGKHHSMFVEESYRQSPEYKEFWAKLNRGEYFFQDFKRIGKGGKEVWIQASYNPIFDLNGKPFKVVKYASDITAQKMALNAMMTDAMMLSKAAVEGKLATRADLNRHQGDYREVVRGVNETLDAVIGPLNVAADYVDKISKGEIPAKISDNYNGDFNLIKNNLNACIDGLAGLQEANVVLQKMSVNDYTVEVEGKYVGIFADVARAINGVQARVKHLMSTCKKVAQGNLEDLAEYQKVGRRSDKDELVPSLTVMQQSIAALVADAAMLSQAAVEGKLSTRADASKHAGDYRKIVEGVNQTLDAVIGPLNVSADYVDKISKGNIPPKITDNYNGDFNVIKNNLNMCIDAVNALVADAVMLSHAAVEGKLSTRADASKHAGDYHKIVEGVNQTLDAVIGPLIVSADYVDKISKGNIPATITDNYNGDFNVIKNNLNACINAVNALVADAVMLSKAAVEGKLSTRADGSKHAGDYRKIVEGVNETLDAVIGPVQEAGAVLKKIAAGDLTAKVTGAYQGDHADIKNDINAMTEALCSSMASIAVNAQSLASSSEELNATSQQLSGNAEETATQANVVSAASEEVSKNVSVVATGSEEMLASIREISKSANEAARVAKNAVEVAHGTNTTISKLGESSAEIGKVIKVITSIAQQTNLLALNATIEAARAGEAGKGFAVVANEVKELAKETARATEEIGQKIEAIQGDTKAAVQAIGEISGIINQVNDISNTIASAVEEQTSTTNEIGRNVTEAAKGTSEIAKNISGVAQAAQETTTGANDLLKAGRSLAEMSTQLQMLVSQFKLQEDAKHVTHNRAAASAAGL